MARRFDATELILTAIGAAAIAAVVSLDVVKSRSGAGLCPRCSGRSVELDRLRNAYGPNRNSQYFEEWIVRDFFRDKRGGFFVDVGANDYKRYSNTYYLDTTLEWSGLAIEPLRQFEADYRLHRPRTKFLPFFVADRSNETASLFYLPENPLVSSSDNSWTRQWGGRTETVSAPTITLTDVLVKEHAPHVDFISIDIELAEPKALAGFDIDRFKPTLVCIEAQPEVRQSILDYFARHRYVAVGRYFDVDIWNLYFVPVDQPASSM